MAELDDEFSELDIAEENDDVPYVEFDISVAPSDPSLELLAQKITRKEIIIPFYQRKFVWKIEASSKLIESFLMGLPVPQVFLYINDENQLEVIDGQQRLMSVNYFLEGYFGETDEKGNRQVFRLKGLSERSEYNGKTFEDLPPQEQRKLNNATLRAINIKQITPDSNNDSVFHLFERLNTGGTLLKPQEIRNAVYRGNIVQELSDLNHSENWQKILGMKKPDKNQKDVELVLRLFSLFEEWEKYSKPMLRYLNSSMKKNRDFDSKKTKLFKKRFASSTKLVADSILKPFRPKRVVNAAVLEGVMVALLENPSITANQLTKNYERLMTDEDFITNTSSGTTNESVLTKRIEIAKRILSDV